MDSNICLVLCPMNTGSNEWSQVHEFCNSNIGDNNPRTTNFISLTLISELNNNNYTNDINDRKL